MYGLRLTLEKNIDLQKHMIKMSSEQLEEVIIRTLSLNVR